MSAARPVAIAASQWAVAGATTIASAESATTMWPIRSSGRSARTSVSTGWRLSAANVSGADEAGRGRRHQDDDVGALVAWRRRTQLDGLVGGDRAGDADGDQPAGEASVAPAVDRHPRAGPARAARRRRPRRGGSRGPSASDPDRSRRSSSSARAHGAADRPPVRIARTSPGSIPDASASSDRTRASSPAVSAW